MDHKEYVFDEESFNFGKEGGQVRKALIWILRGAVVSITMAVVFAVIISLLFSTEEERNLSRENRMLERMYPEMRDKAQLLNDVVTGLKMRDAAIYEEIFEAPAPDLDRLLTVDLLPVSDSIPEEDIVRLTEVKADLLLRSASNVEKNMQRIFELSSQEGFVLPPMHLPIRNFSLPMTGASVGKKMNPFYKVQGQHDGIDLMAPLGEEVIASSDGVVQETVRSRKGPGNVVVLRHPGGYLTKYAHLSDVRVVRGRSVKKGDVLGYVGMTGASFAPHLHYEVWKDSLAQDPVNYFFASVNPYEYVNMFIVSTVTGQSLD